VEWVQELLAALEAQPQVMRERLLRRFVDAWLNEQRAEY